jgi:predicted GNAT family acetyltransferase
MANTPPITHERADDGGLFLMEQEGRQVGELHYQLAGGRMVITHTEVEPRLRGGGFAHQLVDAAAVWAREQKLKILPRCSYARVVLLRSPSHADLVE